MIVVPAIIPKSREQMEEEIKKVSGFAELIQIDISDGIFTPFKTWPYNGVDYDYFEKLKTEEEGLPRWENIEYEFHLMIQDPEEYVESFIHAGASTIIVQIEAVNNFEKILNFCKEAEVSLGVAIKPKTDIEKIKAIVDQVDFIQVMGSDMLGKHGVELEEGAIEKIKEVKKHYPDRVIAVDIGVNLDTKELLKDVGVTKFVTGSAILNSSNPQEVYSELLE